MSSPNPTAKTVNRSEFHKQFDELLHQVTHDKIRLTIEEDGEPVAVVTPIEVDERRQARKRFLERIEEVRQRANLTPEEADELAQEAVEAVRRRTRSE